MARALAPATAMTLFAVSKVMPFFSMVWAVAKDDNPQAKRIPRILASFILVSFCGGGVIVTLLDAAEGRRDAEWWSQ